MRLVTMYPLYRNDYPWCDLTQFAVGDYLTMTTMLVCDGSCLVDLVQSASCELEAIVVVDVPSCRAFALCWRKLDGVFFVSASSRA